jgi:hypothetical protein
LAAIGSGDRMREIGGRNGRLFVASPTGRLGRGFFSSINETVSITGLAGFGASADFAAGSAWARAVSATAVAEARADFVGVSTLVFFTSLRFESDAAATGAAAALAGLRTVAGFRAAVFVVVFVGISIPEKILGHDAG